MPLRTWSTAHIMSPRSDRKYFPCAPANSELRHRCDHRHRKAMFPRASKGELLMFHVHLWEAFITTEFSRADVAHQVGRNAGRKQVLE
jgi:hypothetical protein